MKITKDDMTFVGCAVGFIIGVIAVLISLVGGFLYVVNGR